MPRALLRSQSTRGRACCRLTADGARLSVYGTDLNTGIADRVACDVIESGEAVVDAQRLADIAAKLHGDIRIEGKAEELIIKCGRSRFTLKVQSPEDYPAALTIENVTAEIHLAAPGFMALFAGAATAAARDDKRVYLSGPVLFGEPTDLGYTLCGVGADGVALSYAATAATADGRPDLGQGIIVHRDTCALAVQLFGRTGAQLRIGNGLINLAADTIRLTAKLIDSTPTAWRSMVPADNMTLRWGGALPSTTIWRARPARIASLAIYAGQGRAPIVRIRWDAAAGNGDVCVSYGELGIAPAALDVVDAEAVHGEADINVNPRRLQRLLEGLNEDGDGCDIIMLQAGDCAGDPLRINAELGRFVVLGQIREFSHLEEEAA